MFANVAPCGHSPGGLLIEQRIGFGKMIARRLDPKTQFIEQRQGMVGAVCDEQDGSIQILVQCGKDGQARGARQTQTRELLPVGLDLFQQLLILRS